MSRRPVVIAVVVLLLVAVAACLAQDAKTWEKPGTEVGDEIFGPDGGEMVWVPAGEFMMGSTQADLDYAVNKLNAKAEWFSAEQPAHRVRITKGFWLGKCAVTLGQWKSYCQAAGIEVGQASAPGDNYPVVFVSWDEAKAYCRYYGMALPTEAEWEYAARGHQNRKWPWGDTWDEDKCRNTGNKGPGGPTFPAGSFPDGASWCGALDMAGNVWQWCKDWFDEKYYANSSDADPSGPDTGERRVMRGGSRLDAASFCRSAYRCGVDPAVGYICDLGFRCSRTP